MMDLVFWEYHYKLPGVVDIREAPGNAFLGGYFDDQIRYLDRTNGTRAEYD